MSQDWIKASSVWLMGKTRSGKTARLIEQFNQWAAQTSPTATFLVFAATGDNRITLADRIAADARQQFDSATPLGVFQDDVTLFWPLIAQTLQLNVQFPLRLRPETEQVLATQLWRLELDNGTLVQEGVPEYYLVRRTLDIMQLAAASGTPPEDIATLLTDGLEAQAGSPELWQAMGEAIARWRSWCLERGLLTYSLITELYGRYLLPHPTYQAHLKTRYQAVFADDVDEYPAIARSVFEFFLDQDIPIALTYNPQGAIRLGLGADPLALQELASRCAIQETLEPLPDSSLGYRWGESLLAALQEPLLLPQLPEVFQSIQTVSRAQLLRQTAEVIVEAIHQGYVQPQDVAVIAPGLDAIARYTLREILTSRGIPVTALNDQQPLISSPLIRALLTLLALIYPGLGQLVSREAMAELLVVLSQTPPATSGAIDPVRAGLLTDHCFAPDPHQITLLPVTAFPRWDRLGYEATQSYSAILDWIAIQQAQQQQRLIPSPVVLLDRAIQRFLAGGSQLPYDQLAALRELMETAQHYWEIDTRLRQYHPTELPLVESVGRFIQLLRDGTITADPYPMRPMGRTVSAVTMATIYQYRSDRSSHRWQFWLDAGSPLWLTGGGALVGAPVFLRQWSGRPWTVEDTLEADQQRLQRQVLDLLGRAQERIYFCHSELATNGQEQSGPLLTLVNAALPFAAPPLPETTEQSLEPYP